MQSNSEFALELYDIDLHSRARDVFTHAFARLLNYRWPLGASVQLNSVGYWNLEATPDRRAAG